MASWVTIPAIEGLMSNQIFKCAMPLALTAIGIAIVPGTLRAGVTNPDISVIGQPFIGWTDEEGDPDRLRLHPEIGETELVFDAALNPYARGFFTLAIGEEGLELEEGFFSLNRGLPLDLALKGGQYRVGFGRLNQVHPHANPFSEPFGVLTAYLPGEEAFIDVGASLSRRFALPGDGSLNLSADWLGGDTFRREREPVGDDDPLVLGGDDGASESRPGWVARAAGFSMLGEQSALELGLSATGGTNNVAAGTMTMVLGADAKAKLWTGVQSYLLLQGELLHLDRDDASWDPAAGYAGTNVTGTGGYVYADYNWARRYNLGASFESYEVPGVDSGTETSIGAFAGLALLEETTAFRLDWRQIDPVEGEAFNRVNLRIIFSMGPHKAHQF
jgi:hypothetical protein